MRRYLGCQQQTMMDDLRGTDRVRKKLRGGPDMDAAILYSSCFALGGYGTVGDDRRKARIWSERY